MAVKVLFLPGRRLLLVPVRQVRWFGTLRGSAQWGSHPGTP